MHNNSPKIYLDHNSTTHLLPEVLDTVIDLLNYGPINPSSLHYNGQYGAKIVEDSRRSIAALLGFDNNYHKYRITFTAGGTEANNLVMSNFKNHEIFVSATEHFSIYQFSHYYNNVKVINVDKNGVLDLNDLKKNLQSSKSSKKLVSIMLANNETGIINPIKEISNLSHQYGAKVHSDCIQAIGKINVNINDLNLDFLSISGHKFGAPMGSGALISKAEIDLTAQIIGGKQEKSLRAGTHNVHAIAGLGKAAEIIHQTIDNRITHLSKLRDNFEQQIIDISPNIKIAGKNVKRLPNTSLIIGGKITNAETALILFNIHNIALSRGSACSSGTVKESHVLSSMGYSTSEMNSALRISSGITTTKSDIDSFIKTYKTKI